MSDMNSGIIADRLSRVVKLAMDTGEADSIEEAENLFKGYKLAVSAGPEVGNSPTHQAALLTIVNAGRRSLLGGIEVEGITNMPLLVSLPPYDSLEDAVCGLGGRIVKKVGPTTPLVTLGSCALSGQSFAVRVTFDGWAAGIVPAESDLRLGEQHEFTPSGVLAGSLAVAEAFQYLRNSQPAAGRRKVGLSLWRPELDWFDSEAVGSRPKYLPSKMWLIGLGNLGQAYLWTIGMLPYAEPGKVKFILQDFDWLAESNDSTSLLTQEALIGARKTRAMANWLEIRGFQADIVERPFANNFHVENDEPSLALCGVDNALARSALEDVGFSRVVEMGLGGGASDFLGFRLHTFPGERSAHDLWKDTDTDDDVETDLPAYQALAKQGLDRCGLTQLAGRTVGAPFVGSAAAAIVIGEILRLTNGEHTYELIDGHLRDLENRTVVATQKDLPAFNPGTIAVL